MQTDDLSGMGDFRISHSSFDVNFFVKYMDFFALICYYIHWIFKTE